MKKRTPDIDAVEIARKQRHLYLLSQVKNGRHLSRSELKELNQLEDMAKKRTKGQKDKGAKGKFAAIAESQILRTQRQAAVHASVSARTIRRWLNEGMLTAQVAGKTVYIKSQLDFFKRNEGRQPTEAKTKSQTADADYKDAKAKLMQMELEIKQGTLIRLEDVQQGRTARVQAVKRALLGLPRKLPPLLEGKSAKKMQSIIRNEVTQIIAGFARG